MLGVLLVPLVSLSIIVFQRVLVLSIGPTLLNDYDICWYLYLHSLPCPCWSGPVSLTFFCPKFKFDENFPCHNSVAGHKIATNFCTCHDSTAVVPCTKLCSDHCIRIEVRVKRNFNQIWIAMEKSLVKRAPGPSDPHHQSVSPWKPSVPRP